jgi:hypothetical protein
MVMPETVAVAVVGSRNFSDLELVRKYVASLAYHDDRAIIVTGGARGVDEAAEATALDYSLLVQVIKPDWERHGKAAGPIRNEQIVRVSDEVVAFWDGKSRGTKSTIELTRKARKPLTIFFEDGRKVREMPKQLALCE